MKYFPVYLDLRARAVLFVGGGAETEVKVLQLLKTGACLHVVCATPLPALARLAKDERLQYRIGEFHAADLDGKWLVVAATEDSELNQAIASAAAARNVFCNIVDVTPLCSFIYPAIVARGDVQIAISTSGTSPALAQKLKREIANIVGPELAALADLLGELRQRVIAEIPNRQDRADLFHRLVESDLLELLRYRQPNAARQLAEEILTSAISQSRRSPRKKPAAATLQIGGERRSAG